MQSIKHLLVILDRDHKEQPALQRAVQLALTTQARIHIITQVYQAGLDEATLQIMDLSHDFKEALLDQANSWLEEIIAALDRNQLNITHEVLWQPHLADAAAVAMQQHNYDLILKAIQPHKTLIDRLLTPSDWNLLRNCQAPLLLVHQSEGWKNNRILAAIDASSTDPGHKILNENVLQMAEQFSGYMDADLHIVNASPILAMAFAMVPEAPAPEDMQEEIRQQHERAAITYGKKYNVEEDHVHVSEGEPESVIIEQAKISNTDLVIIGTIARDGLSGAFLGNTAESVADQLPCDLLAVKIQDGVGQQDQQFEL